MELTEEQKALFEEEANKRAEAATAALKEELAKKEADLKALQDKDLNFGNLRKQTAEEVKKVADEKAAAEAALAEVSKKVADLETNISQAAEERKSRLVKAYAGKDEELEKKILFQFDKVKGSAKTDAEIEEAIKDAYILATGGRADEDVIKHVQNSGSSGARVVAKPSGTDITPEVKVAADEFNKYGANITPEDLANPKYQVKPGQSAESSYNL